MHPRQQEVETSRSETNRSIGIRLAEFVLAQGGQLPPVAVLQGVVADLAADKHELVLPLKHLVGLPGFPAVAHKAASGLGNLERDALIQSLGDLFSPRIVGALDEVLTGFLHLPNYSSGNAKDDLGDKQGAIADYNQAIAINPPYVEAYTNRSGESNSFFEAYHTAVSNSKLRFQLGAFFAIVFLALLAVVVSQRKFPFAENPNSFLVWLQNNDEFKKGQVRYEFEEINFDRGDGCHAFRKDDHYYYMCYVSLMEYDYNKKSLRRCVYVQVVYNRENLGYTIVNVDDENCSHRERI